MLDHLLLFFLLLVALFLRLLLSFFADGQLSREQEKPPRHEPTTAPLPPLRPPVSLATRAPVSGSPVNMRATPSLRAASVPQARQRHRALDLRRPALRHGMILMAILGPCRAQQPLQPPQ